MTDSTLTHLVLVLDRSGSMAESGKAEEAEKGVRALVDEQIALPGRLEITVARFDDQYELLVTGIAADDLDRDMLRIEPRNMTALFDAVGRTVVAVGETLRGRKDNKRPGRVIVLVATDGLENSSREYSGDRLRELIELQTDKYAWEFMFMGTSQEAVLQAQQAGFKPRMTMASSDSGKGMHSAYAAASSSILRARSTGASVELTDEERANLQ